MSSQFRLGVATLATAAAMWVGAAFADWPFATQVARLEPGYGGVCEQCDLSGRILVGARMTNAVFRRTNFSRAILTRANAANSVFDFANFDDADMTDSKFVDARLRGASFRNALMDGANFSAADLRAAEALTQRQLSAACGDDRTLLPRGLSIPHCGSKS